MTRDEALKLLKLDACAANLTEAIITRAWRGALIANHPDTAAAGVPVDYLTTAKKMLLADVSERNITCTLCAGRGKVRHGMGTRACVACKGTGDRRP